MTKREQNAVDNFLASLVDGDAMVAHEAFENARADAKSYGWSADALEAVIQGICRFYEAKHGYRNARLADKAGRPQVKTYAQHSAEDVHRRDWKCR